MAGKECLQLVVGARRGGRVLLDEVHEAILVTGAIVRHDVTGGTLDKVDGGEALHVELGAGHIVGSGVHLGNLDLVVTPEGGANLSIRGCQALAVSAPRRVELNENIVATEDNLIELLGHNDANVVLIGLGRDISRLDGLLELAILEILDKLAKCRQLSREQVPLALVVVCNKGGQLLVADVKELLDAVEQVHGLVGIHEGQVIMLLGRSHESFQHRRVLARRAGQAHNLGGRPSAECRSKRLAHERVVSEGNDARLGYSLQPLLESHKVAGENLICLLQLVPGNNRARGAIRALLQR
mmetsp:Transcript_14647/g.25881  ORF Transcript_14647/g.25881 Transcript_14647/m.25881 type:complete len:298 (-) Transcript_14647:667-1560(-)